MEAVSADDFASWLPPNDVLDHFIAQFDPDPHGHVTALLRDGILQAAAGRLIVAGRNMGLSVIPKEFWMIVGKSEVWSTGRFHIESEQGRISAYDVRIDRNFRDLPARVWKPLSGESRQPELTKPDERNEVAVSHRALQAWFDLFIAAYPNGSIEQAWASAKGMFADKRVTRGQVRALMPNRPKGRPRKNKDNP